MSRLFGYISVHTYDHSSDALSRVLYLAQRRDYVNCLAFIVKQDLPQSIRITALYATDVQNGLQQPLGKKRVILFSGLRLNVSHPMQIFS